MRTCRIQRFENHCLLELLSLPRTGSVAGNREAFGLIHPTHHGASSNGRGHIPETFFFAWECSSSGAMCILGTCGNCSSAFRGRSLRNPCRNGAFWVGDASRGRG